MVGRIIISCLLFSLNAAGQELDSIGNGHSGEGAHTLMGRLKQVQLYLDSAARKKVDPHYIEIPQKPWRVILRYKANTVDVDYENCIDLPEDNRHTDWKMCFKPRMASSLGFWVGYRGLGISYSKSLIKNAGRYFSFGATGAKYGFNFRLRRFKTDEMSLTGKDYKNGEVIEEVDDNSYTFSPVWIRSVYINGYYVFNGRRYSQAAAYNQSVIQRRSAGSFLVGATLYQSSLDYSDRDNAGMMILSHNIGRIKLQQASIGAGYGYNFVPLRGLVINAMAMPSLSFYNRVKVYKYDFNYDLSSPEGQTDDYGEWNPETRTWDNGKTHKPLEMTDDEGEWLEGVDYWESEPETVYSPPRFSIDVRLGIAYNWRNYFIGLQGQLNYFTYKKDNSKVSLTDGYAQVSMGVRL